MATLKKYSDINKIGDTFSITSKLADYSIHPDWKNGYNTLINPNVQSEYKFLWQTVSASCEDIGSEIYKKILNYIDNISNVDTCEIHALQSFAKMYGYNESILYVDYSFPTEILELINIFSINKAYILGPNSILDSTSLTELSTLSGNDVAYRAYIYDIIYNTLVSFCNMKYRENEVDNIPSYIWQSNIAKYSTNLFSQDTTSDPDIMLKKITLNIPMYFPERRYVDEIQQGLRKIIDFTVSEQVILNMEISRRALARNTIKNISKYSYERENKVSEYFRFVTLFANAAFSTTTYDIDIKKVLILDQSMQSLIVYQGNNNYDLDYSLIDITAKKLVDLCIRISYIRETIKNQAQKYYMSGTENLLLNLVREVLFTTLYNDVNSVSGYWRYNYSDNSLFNKNITLNPKLDINLIEYIDPTEYYNIANTSEISAVGTNGLNTRYWENSAGYDGDISTDELLQFYNKLGLGDLFTTTYGISSSTLSSSQYGALSAYSLSGFLAAIFNSGATSATSATIHTETPSSQTTYPIYTQMPTSGWNSTTSGSNLYNVAKYIAVNELSGIYTSSDAITWSKADTPVVSGWTAIVYNPNNNIYVATNKFYGIFYSLDDGITWINEESTTIYTNWINIAYDPVQKTLCAINNKYGIYYSNNGIIWTKYTAIATAADAGWTDIVYVTGNNINGFVATNNLYGVFRSTDGGNTWSTITTNGPTNYWIALATSNMEDQCVLVNSLSGLYMTTSTAGAFARTTDLNGKKQGWLNATSNSTTYTLTHSTSGIFNSSGLLNSATLTQNTTVNPSGWSYINCNNGIYTAQNNISGFVYTTTPGTTWNTTSGTYLSAGTITYPASSYTDPGSAIFLKYSGNPLSGTIPYANIKNTVHSSYQLHPFLLSFKQYNNAITGIANLYNGAIPSKAILWQNIKNRIDNYGNTVNYWLDGNDDFSGYSSYYETTYKDNNQKVGQDSPFNFDVLSAYLTQPNNFFGTNAPLASAYYNFLGLPDNTKTKINNQLYAFYNNITELANYRIYKYGKDAYGNAYMLYKKLNTDNERGQLWIRLKNHPIAFPAFILEQDNSLSNLGQISNTTLNTLDDILSGSYDIDNGGPLSAQMQFENIIMTVSGVSGTVGASFTTLATPVNVIYSNSSSNTDRDIFTTIGLSANAELSGYFVNEINGIINGDNTVSMPNSFTPTISSASVSSTPHYITFNSGKILLNNSYRNTAINVVGDNIFEAEHTYSFYNNLNTFYDFGFNYNKDTLFLDYLPLDTSKSYEKTNTLFGEIDVVTTDVYGNKELRYIKDPVHNLESLQQYLINTYTHVDTIINEKDIYFIYRSSITKPTDFYSVNIYLFKYNVNDGLSYKLYTVPIKYDMVANSTWKATISNSILSVAFMSQNPLNTTYIGNYVSSYETTSGIATAGKTQFESILPTTYLNGFTVIQFNIIEDLPTTHDVVKYFYKHTELGYYPQYYGIIGKNNFYSNPVIKSAPYYNLQLFIQPSNVSTDFIYEQTFNASPTISSIYTDMNSIAFSAVSAYDATTFLYTTSAYKLSSNPSLSSEPMKWFRKYDLSGDYTLINTLSTGIDLSVKTLSPSSYIYHGNEAIISGANTYYPSLSNAPGTNENSYGLLELDENYTIRVYFSSTDGNNIDKLYFIGVNDLVNTTAIYLSSNNETKLFEYNYSGIIKYYNITLVSKYNKLFTITRV